MAVSLSPSLFLSCRLHMDSIPVIGMAEFSYIFWMQFIEMVRKTMAMRTGIEFMFNDCEKNSAFIWIIKQISCIFRYQQ